MAGLERFELPNGGTKNHCLSPWLQAKIGGERGIRTPVLITRTDLQSAAFNHFAISPFQELNQLNLLYYIVLNKQKNYYLSHLNVFIDIPKNKPIQANGIKISSVASQDCTVCGTIPCIT